MGMSNTNDEFCCQTDLAYEGLQNIHKVVDDILISGSTKQECLDRVRQVLERSRQFGITISRKKVQFGQSISYGGFLIRVRDDRIEFLPSPELMDAIRHYPVPTDLTSLRGFLGLLNQLADWNPDTAQSTEKMRTLLRKGIAWCFDHDILAEFKAAKTNLTGGESGESAVNSPFDPSLETVLLSDASKLRGFGYILLQKRDDGKHNIIRCGSCSLRPAHRNYAPIELEALGVTWAISKCTFFLSGLDNFEVLTDHQPLVNLWKKDLCDVTNRRLFKCLENTMMFNFRVTYTPGKYHLACDALSRNPLLGEMEADDDATDGVYKLRYTYTSSKSARDDLQLAPLFDAAVDTDYQMVVKFVREGGKLDKVPIDHPAKAYKHVIDTLSVYDDNDVSLLVVDDTRLVVPPGARPAILKALHLPHAGFARTKATAQERYYWPQMTKHIEAMVDGCDTCRLTARARPREPYLANAIPLNRLSPMEEVGADFFEINGTHWVLMVDRYSGFPFAKKSRHCRTEDATGILENWFNAYGWPNRLRCDGGPAFRKDFADWCKDHFIHLDTSSAYNPTSNGLAESGVGRVKKVIQRASLADESVQKALAAHRNTKTKVGTTPSLLFFGRHLRGVLPALPRKVDVSGELAKREKSREKWLGEADRRSWKGSPIFDVGEKVWCQNYRSGLWDIPAEVVKVRKQERSYLLIHEQGGQPFLRNRRFVKIRKDSAPADDGIPQASVDPASCISLVTPPAAESRRSARIAGRVESRRDQRSDTAVVYSTHDGRVSFKARRGEIGHKHE